VLEGRACTSSKELRLSSTTHARYIADHLVNLEIFFYARKRSNFRATRPWQPRSCQESRWRPFVICTTVRFIQTLLSEHQDIIDNLYTTYIMDNQHGKVSCHQSATFEAAFPSCNDISKAKCRSTASDHEGLLRKQIVTYIDLGVLPVAINVYHGGVSGSRVLC
jgi:hypothetical protein